MPEYVAFKTGPWARPTAGQQVLKRILSALLPQANPDLEPLYEMTHSWWFEVVAGSVHREVGFDASGAPIVVAPWHRNLGIFTDLGAPPKGAEPGVEGGAFEDAWTRGMAALEARTPPNQRL